MHEEQNEMMNNILDCLMMAMDKLEPRPRPLVLHGSLLVLLSKIEEEMVRNCDDPKMFSSVAKLHRVMASKLEAAAKKDVN